MFAVRAILIWGVLAGLAGVPIAVAAGSAYLQYRSAIYVAAGLAGVVALALLLLQPLLAAGLLPGLPRAGGRRVHRWTGAALVIAVGVHVAGLWITSPPDMVDALTFTAPTVFSVVGVVSMWALVVAALLAGLRRTLRLRPQVWRLAHSAAAAIVVGTGVAHAIMIEGTMGTGSKLLLCIAVVAALALTLHRLRSWAGVWRPRGAPTRD